MRRIFAVLAVLLVVLLAMAFAAVNAGHRATLSLGIVTLYRAPVTLVVFAGLVVGMVVMFATGIYTDLKVRRILRERLIQESRQEQTWIDRNQQDLFAPDPERDGRKGGDPPAPSSGEASPSSSGEAISE